MPYSQRTEYYYLPEIYHDKHDICEFMVYEIEKFITNESYKDLKVQNLDIPQSEFLSGDEHILDLLLRTNRTDEHNKIVSKHIIYSTIIDACYFLQEALLCSMKKRLTVTFALIRKPFVFDLVILLRLYFTEDFINEFNSNPKFDAPRLKSEEVLQLLEISTKTLVTDSITATDLYDFIFNLKKTDSLINITNKALHPSTTYNSYNLTGIQNLNFFFSTNENINTQWNYIYARLPVLLIHMLEVLEFIIDDVLDLGGKVYSKSLEERAEFLSKKRQRVTS